MDTRKGDQSPLVGCTFPAVSSSNINSTSRNARDIILAQPKWIVPPDTTRSTSTASPVQNDKRKQQIVLSEHAARNLTSTNVTFANLEGQLTRPTVESIDDNSILGYRKPPDSKNVLLSASQSKKTDKCTTVSNICDSSTATPPSDVQLIQPTGVETVSV